MKVLVTGSSGHLGEALVRLARQRGHDTVGVDPLPSPFTDVLGSITDADLIARHVDGADAILHTATLHKPHVATHSRQDFVDTNITGTLALLEAAVAAGVGTFVFTSTTSVFGRALQPGADEPAAWITEQTVPIPKNIYGVTKACAEDLCELFHRRHGLQCLVLRTSRFFLEEDDDRATRAAYADTNAKVNEFLYRRVDLEDAAEAHFCAVERAATVGFGRYIISATTPFAREDLAALRADAPGVVRQLAPEFAREYSRRGWRMFPSIGRVYVNALARSELDWKPRFDFRHVLQRLRDGREPFSDLARIVGSKPYHDREFTDGPYPVE